MPAGAIADIGDGWRLQVLSVTEDGTAAVLAEIQFNDPPSDGSWFTLVAVSLGYYGLDDPTSGFMTTIAGVASANTELDTDCGVIPNELNRYRDVFAGGVVAGNLCFVTTAADSGVLQLYGTTGFGGREVFLDASATPASVEPMPPLRGPQPGGAATDYRRSAIQVGVPSEVGEGWTFTVTAPAQDITDAVLAENRFNDPPPDGYRVIGVPVNFEYAGDSSANAFEITDKGVGDSIVVLDEGCGVVPAEVDRYADIFAGGSVVGTLCLVAPIDDAGTITLYTSALLDDDYSYFATQ